jgi:hypothetical protein
MDKQMVYKIIFAIACFIISVFLFWITDKIGQREDKRKQ